MYLRNYRDRKIWLDKNLESPVSEDPYTDNRENGSRHCGNLNTAHSQSLLNAVKVLALEKVSFSDAQNSTPVC